MRLFAKLSPKFRNCTDVALWCIELLKGAYGLKDAPLLWNLKLVAVLVDELKLLRSAHDGCDFYMVSEGLLVLVISLHVDDTFITGKNKYLRWIHTELEKRFGTVKCEKNEFKHFGIMVNRSNIGDVVLDQTFYLELLKPIEIESASTGRRLLESPSSPSERTALKSLIGGMSWMSMTSPLAQAQASLLQHLGPEFSMSDLKAGNEALDQLRASYQPLRIKHGFDLQKVKLLVISDSSLGNAGEKYSQGAFWVVLAKDKTRYLCGDFVLLAHVSARSKRVASSTFAAETLALMLGTEEALFIQTWLHELSNPEISVRELCTLPGRKLVPIDVSVDCRDVYEVLIKSATPNVTNKSLALYVAALRQEKEQERIRNIAWIDTRDMLVNAFTKYESKGLLPLLEPDVVKALKRCFWEPKYLFEMNGVKIMPRH